MNDAQHQTLKRGALAAELAQFPSWEGPVLGSWKFLPCFLAHTETTSHRASARVQFPSWYLLPGVGLTNQKQNIQYPTSNAEHRTKCEAMPNWVLDVGCSLLDVFPTFGSAPRKGRIRPSAFAQLPSSEGLGVGSWRSSTLSQSPQDYESVAVPRSTGKRR